MVNVIIPYLVPLLLGKTIDLTTYDSLPYGQVFKGLEYDETPVHNFSTTYRVLQEDMYPYEFLNHPVDMGILSKAGNLQKLNSMSSLVNDISWKYRSPVVVIKSIYRTVDRSLKKEAPKMELDKNTEFHIRRTETHYVTSMSYGGYVYAFYHIDCHSPADVDAVRKLVTKELGVEGVFTKEIAEKFEKVVESTKTDKSLTGPAFIHPQIVSSLPSFLSVYDGSPSELLENINRIPEQVGSLGVALTTELKPLHDIDDKYRIAKYHPEMKSVLEKVDEMFDDVKIADDRFRQLDDQYWDRENEAKQIGQVLKHLKKCRKAFFLITYNVSLFKEMNNDTLNEAFQLYKEGLETGVTSYCSAHRRMEEHLKGAHLI